jgi:hypothetical protein
VALPVIGDWTDITGNPDLGALTRPGQQPVDFAIWQAADGTWHIWECIRFTLVGGESRLFFHFQATSPFGPWTPVGVAMTADPAVGEVAGGLQAPYVFTAGGKYHMFYGTWEAICSQTSDDGITFTRVLDATGKCPLFSEGPTANTRDPMLIESDGAWYAYYTAADTEANGTTGSVYARVSADLATWSDSVVVSFGGAAGTGGTSTECPFVVHRPNGYYLFRTQDYGETPQSTVYASEDPLDFGVASDRFRLGTLPVAAPEIFDVDGQPYIAALKLGLDGIRIAPLHFDD